MARAGTFTIPDSLGALALAWSNHSSQRVMRIPSVQILFLALSIPDTDTTAVVLFAASGASLALLCLAERLIIGPYLMTNLEA
jgi:hypothetical protein